MGLKHFAQKTEGGGAVFQWINTESNKQTTLPFTPEYWCLSCCLVLLNILD